MATETQRNEPSVDNALDLLGKAWDEIAGAVSKWAERLGKKLEKKAVEATLAISKAGNAAIDGVASGAKQVGKAAKDVHESAVAAAVGGMENTADAHQATVAAASRGIEHVAKIGQVLGDQASHNIGEVKQAAKRGGKAVENARQAAVDTTADVLVSADAGISRGKNTAKNIGKKIGDVVVAAYEESDPENQHREQVSKPKKWPGKKPGENILASVKDISDKGMTALSKKELGDIMKSSNPEQVRAILGATDATRGILDVAKLQRALAITTPGLVADGKLWEKTIDALKKLTAAPATTA